MGGFYSFFIPLRAVFLNVADLLEGFAFVLDTRSLAVAYGYVAGYLLVFFENVSVFDFSVADSCPAAVKTYALGEEN